MDIDTPAQARAKCLYNRFQYGKFFWVYLLGKNTIFAFAFVLAE